MALFTLGRYLESQITITITTDANNRITLVEVTNLTGRTLTIDFRRSNGTGPRYTHDFGPGTTSLTIPTSPAGRLQITLLDRGRFDGLDGQVGVN